MLLGKRTDLFVETSGWDMQEEYAFLFSVALYKNLSFLDHKAASALIMQPVKDYYTFEQKAVERIMRITSCHPYYTQLLCHCLFNCWQQQRVSPITTQVVNDVLDEAVERGLAVLKHVWEESTASEKAIMVGMAEIAEESGLPIETHLISRTWANCGVILPSSEIAKATRNLVAREVIIGQDKYAFAVELQRLWVRKYRRLEWVKEEIAEAIKERAPAVATRPPSSRWEKWRISLQILGIVLVLLLLLKLLIPSPSVPFVANTPTISDDATIAKQIYEQAVKQKPIFASLNNQQDSNVWERGSLSSGTCSFTDHAYHVYVNAIKSSHNLTYCFPKASTFTNFVFQVHMTFLKGNGGGIIFRANTTEAKWYFFALQPDESYVLYVYKGLGSAGSYIITPLLGESNPIISPKINELTVIAKNNDIYFLVNGQYLFKQVDDTYSSGNIGFLVADSQNLTDIAFTNAGVWQITS